MVGVVLALLVSGAGGPSAVWGKTIGIFLQPENTQTAAIASDRDLERELDQQKPQKQAELLLERAVSRSDAPPKLIAAQIEARIDGWRGQLQWDSQLGDLTTVALNSSDPSVRASAIEVQLAAYGLAKNKSTVDRLIVQADASDHAQKTWALWGLGLLGNRGVETPRVVQVLAAHLQASGTDSSSGKNDNDEDTRRWAIEGLALVGTTPTIVPLLKAMHNDPSAIVRERAACSLAKSGMLSHEQRLAAIPQLINYSGDPTLDAQTRAWAFQALADITEQHLPNDPAAWREWYQKSVLSGQ